MEQLLAIFETPIKALEILVVCYLGSMALKLIYDVKKDLRKNGNAKNIALLTEIKNDIEHIKADIKQLRE